MIILERGSKKKLGVGWQDFLGGCQIFVAGGVSKNFGGADVSTIFLKVGWQNFGVGWLNFLEGGVAKKFFRGEGVA